MQKWIVIVLVLITIVSCKYFERDKPSKAEVQELMKKRRVARLAKRDSLPPIPDSILNQLTAIKFEQEIYDFGKIKEGEVVVKDIVYTNTGKNPLVIINAWGSCGCTVPTFDRKPLASGASDTLTIEFNSTGKKGSHTKSVYVQANTLPTTSTIKFSVKVK